MVELAARGYAVTGDLEDLAGAEPGVFTDPDAVGPDELLPPALDAIKALLVEGARQRAEEERLHEEIRGLHAELDRARGPFPHRLRRKVVRTLEDSATGRAALRVYRRAKRRSA